MVIHIHFETDIDKHVCMYAIIIMSYNSKYSVISLGPFYGAVAVPSVTCCRRRRRRRCRGHRCAHATVATPGEWAYGGSQR